MDRHTRRAAYRLGDSHSDWGDTSGCEHFSLGLAKLRGAEVPHWCTYCQ